MCRRGRSLQEFPGAGGAVLPGVNATPRRTSPYLAALTMVNCSPEAAAGLVLARRSVMETKRFGSAPWSALLLTVDVVAQIVAVPSALTRPVMLRRPAVAGFSDDG